MNARWLGIMAALAIAACAQRNEVDVPPSGAATGDSAPHGEHAAHADPGAGAPLSGMSIYQLDAKWTDQHGAARRLGDLRGRRQLVAMVYTNCTSACPRIITDMKRIEAAVPDVGFVLVSIDPERDTPGRLHVFATGVGLGERWTLLNGTEEAISELAAVLGVRYRRVSEREFVHSNVITLLNEDGEAVYRQEALGEVEGTLAALRK